VSQTNWNEEKAFNLTQSDIFFLFASVMHVIVDLNAKINEAQRERLLKGLQEMMDKVDADPEMYERSLREFLPAIAEKVLGMAESFKPLND
jgi:hypothetical protein